MGYMYLMIILEKIHCLGSSEKMLNLVNIWQSDRYEKNIDCLMHLGTVLLKGEELGRDLMYEGQKLLLH